MKLKNKYFPVHVLIICTLSLAAFAYTLFTNSDGYSRIYIDSDFPFIYHLNDLTPANYFSPIYAGVQVWEDVPSAYCEFDYGGTTPTNTDGLDGTNLVYFDAQGVNFPVGTTAIAYSRTWATGGGSSYRAVESDMIWNSRDYPPSTTGASGQHDLQSVIAHEFGHHLGLGHAGPAGSPPGIGPLITAATMYGYSTAGDTTKRSLHIDDIAAVSLNYPVWTLEGTVTDSLTEAAIDSAKIFADNICFSITTPVEFDSTSGRYQKAGYYVDSLVSAETGYYSAVIIEQNFNLSATYFGYETKTFPISFNAPAGIGQTESIIQDFQLTKNPFSNISGVIIDSLTLSPIQSSVKIYVISNKPGAPDGVLIDTTTNQNGEFTFSVPASEDYFITIQPEAPYAGKEIIVNNLDLVGLNLTVEVNPADILLVDDDNGKDYEQFYFRDLNETSITYHWWDISTKGIPDNQVRSKFDSNIMIWFTGDSSSMPLTTNESNEILDHLSSGGSVFLTGQDIAEMDSGNGITDSLNIEFVQNSTSSIIMGISGNVISNAFVFIASGYGGANNQTSSDIIGITDSSTTSTIFHYGSGNTNPAGVKYYNAKNNSKAIFLGFGYEAINNPDRRKILISRIMDYFQNTSTSIGNEFLTEPVPQKFELFQNYPNPFNPKTLIKYSLPKSAHVQITIYNSLGQTTKKLINEEVAAGTHKIIWNGKNNEGKQASSGVYFYEINVINKFRAVKKMLMIR